MDGPRSTCPSLTAAETPLIRPGNPVVPSRQAAQQEAGMGVRRRSAMRTGRLRALVAITLAASSLVVAGTPEPAASASLPPGFQEEIVFAGLTQPTAVRFSPDGRVFVAEKSGLIKVFDNLTDTTPTVFADLRTQVHNFWDRGLLGLALAAGFQTVPWVFVHYTC